MAEPTGVMTFGDLITEVADKIGVAFLGDDGTEEPQIPRDAHDLSKCMNIVNKAIRMFIHDAPQPNGWRWLRPVASLILWPSVGISGKILTAIFASGQTTITVSSPVFIPAMIGATFSTDGDDFIIADYISSTSVILTGDASAHIGDSFTLADVAAPNEVESASFSSTLGTTSIVVTHDVFLPSMELKTILLGGSPFIVAGYVSPTVVVVTGDASAHVGDSFAVKADGSYTLPSDFGGQFIGHPTFAAGTNRGFSLEFVDESVIRERQANVTSETGIPLAMAVRVMGVGSPRRRWEALFHPIPGGRGLYPSSPPHPCDLITVLFPYILHFQKLVVTSEVSPAPFGHDESIKAACRAVAEKDVEDALGMEWQYYRSIALPNSYRVDTLSAPKRLGYMGNGPRGLMSVHTWRDLIYQRPVVSVNL